MADDFVQRIHITTAPGKPLATVKRALGKRNVGLYCDHCAEFFAFTVEMPNHTIFEFTSDGPLLVRCPFCEAEDHRRPEEFQRLLLTEGKKRRAPRSDRSS